jgi:hypothetical protein
MPFVPQDQYVGGGFAAQLNAVASCPYNGYHAEKFGMGRLPMNEFVSGQIFQ